MPAETQMIDGLRVFDFGKIATGPKVIFLHGGPGLHGYMEVFCESIAGDCRAVYYEQRGSKQGNCDIGIADHLRDLERVVARCTETEKPIIVGHSWGAMLAVLYAGRFSNTIQKAVLVGCGPLSEEQGEEFQCVLSIRFGDHEDEYDQLWNSILVERDSVKQQLLADEYIDRMMEICQMDPYSGAEIQPRHWDFKGGYKTMCESDEYIARNMYVDALSKIDVPLTLIQGDRDVVSPESLFSLARQKVSELRTFEVADAGHYPWAGSGRDEFLKILKQETGCGS